MNYLQDIKTRFDGFGFEQQKYLFATDDSEEKSNEEDDEDDEENEDSDTFEENYFG